MAGALIKLGSLCEQLPQAEKQVAKYILKHSEKIPLLSVSELARLAHVSVASVSRLPKKIGYSGFGQLKIAIAREAVDEMADIFQAINHHDSDQDVVRKVFGGNIRSLEDTLKLVETPSLAAAAKMISESERLILCGIGSSGHLAADAALRFAHLGFHADAYLDSYQMLVQIIQAGRNAVVVGLSHSGRSRATVEGMKLARKNRAKTIGISNYGKSPLSQVSDIMLCTAFAEPRVRVAALSSRISQMCLIDALYVLVARQKTHRVKTALLNDVTEEVLRCR